MFPQSHAQVWLMARLCLRRPARHGSRRCAGLPFASSARRRAVFAGGAVDGPMRLIAQHLSKRLGNQSRREQARRRSDDRQRARRQVSADAKRCCWLPDQCDQCDLVSAPGLRSDRRLAPISLIGREPRRRRQSCAAGADLAAVDRLRQGASRADRLCVVRQRQRPAPVRRAALFDDRHEAQSHSISRQRSGNHRPPRRPGVAVDSGHGRHARPYPRRQAPCARRDRKQARATVTRRADDGRGRRSGYVAYVWLDCSRRRTRRPTSWTSTRQ